MADIVIKADIIIKRRAKKKKSRKRISFPLAVKGKLPNSRIFS